MNIAITPLLCSGSAYREWLRSLGAVVLLMAGCGGGGGGGNDDAPAPTTDPFGLTERAPLAPIALPTESMPLGSYELVNRFPDLDFASATYLSGVPGDDRLVVLEQAGRLLAFDNDPEVNTTRVILDISGEVLFDGEQGLLGLAFDPDFVSNRYLYVHYSLDAPRRSVIARFTWDAASDQVDVASRRILLELPQPFANHNGGMLAFGPDGFLYVAFGDGGSGGDPGNRAQDLGSWFGTLLRIDVHPANPGDAYDVPADNPYVGDPAARDEIWVHGLRNPFRFSFDRATGDLWLGDVGQNTTEEIDLISRGGNYGWRVYEGNDVYDDSANTLPRSAFTFPVYTYASNGGAAVIGGYVYRGSALPGLRGRYVYADFVTGQVWALRYEGGGVTDNEEIARAAGPTSFGEDNAGEIYLVTRGSGVFGFDEAGSGGSDIPDLLSETGLFTDLDALTPGAGLIEYALNLPFWSDGASKRRWIAVPDGNHIGFAATGSWQFPVGTVLVKHFELALTEGDPSTRRRLETRVLVNTTDAGWRGFTYRWNDQQTDAQLLSGGAMETITVETSNGPRDQVYEYPSETDCLQCHTEAAGGVLGVKTRQLNRDRLFEETNVTDNQLRAWNHIGLFGEDIGDAEPFEAFPALDDSARSLEERARAYLDVNCAQCHRPGGPAPGDLDLRFDTGTADTGAIDAAPQQGDLEVADARIIAPGNRERSVLWLRMQRLDETRMPPLASHAVDDEAVALAGDWIDTL